MTTKSVGLREVGSGHSAKNIGWEMIEFIIFLYSWHAVIFDPGKGQLFYIILFIHSFSLIPHYHLHVLNFSPTQCCVFKISAWLYTTGQTLVSSAQYSMGCSLDILLGRCSSGTHLDYPLLPTTTNNTEMSIFECGCLTDLYENSPGYVTKSGISEL